MPITVPIYHSAPPWQPARSQDIEFHHGCTTDDLVKIAGGRSGPYTGALDVAAGRVDVDFGRGFYTTTVPMQARQWAWYRFYDPKFRRTTGCQPCVLTFVLKRHDLAALQSIAFALGHYNDEDFWSLVQHCRKSVNADSAKGVAEKLYDHLGPVTHPKGGQWYDIAYGPVAAFWYQRSAMVNTDQMSFHTTAAQDMLNDAINSGRFRWAPVV